MDRRYFIKNLGYASAGLAVACTTLGRRASALAQTDDLTKLRAYGFGELFPTPAKNTGETFLKLPKGFEYNVIGRTGLMMADGRPVPDLPDGMATFKVGGELRIVRNHEIYNSSLPKPGSAIGSSNHYDEAAGGGTVTMIVDPKTRTVTRDWVSLSGTVGNCAGGPTPWGSWITCEETIVGPSIRTMPNGRKRGGFAMPHGYCFEVPAAANETVRPVPLKDMGRFEHEAIAVDPKADIIYLTEDYDPCGFYRFLPDKKKRLAEGGTLQMLAVTGKPNYDTRTGQTMNVPMKCEWVTIYDPDPPTADLDPQAVSRQGRTKGAAIFTRLEGICTDKNGNIYISSTNGGNSKGGQIWRYHATSHDGGLLTLLFESPDRSILDMPDNLTVRPKTDLLFICEDSDYEGAGGTPENCIRILTRDGRIADLAVNIYEKKPRAEFAGTTFSRDGKTLFVNIQQAGVTLAIWGDWSKFRASA